MSLPAFPTRFGTEERGAPRGERAWIEWIRQRAGQSRVSGAAGVQLGIGDDCAVLRPGPDEDLVVTTDFCLEGRHFRRDWHPAASAGHRTLARGLSDLAAMGARPLAAFLSLAIPASDAEHDAWTEAFLGGLLRLAQRFAVPLAGGDTSQSPSEHLLADIVLLGTVPNGTALRRSGARPGDALYLSGTLGGAFAELEIVQAAAERRSRMENTFVAAGPDEAARHDAHPQLYPEPRLATAEALRRKGLATACLDVSDGLSTDLTHLCEASQVGAVVEWDALPVSSWVGALPPEQRRHAILHGGEEYELLFTTRPKVAVPTSLAGVPLTRIGTLTEHRPGEAMILLQEERGKQPLFPGGWEHLR